MKHCTVLFMAFSVLLSGMTSAAKNPVQRIYTTAEQTEEVPGEEAESLFDCSQQVFTVVEFKGLPRQTHDLVFIWTDPIGKQRERTEYQFEAMEAIERMWAWLKLHRPTGGTIGSFLDPAMGMREFIGEWKVRLLLDGKPVAATKFEVIC